MSSAEVVPELRIKELENLYTIAQQLEENLKKGPKKAWGPVNYLLVLANIIAPGIGYFEGQKIFKEFYELWVNADIRTVWTLDDGTIVDGADSIDGWYASRYGWDKTEQVHQLFKKYSYLPSLDLMIKFLLGVEAVILAKDAVTGYLSGKELRRFENLIKKLDKEYKSLLNVLTSTREFLDSLNPREREILEQSLLYMTQNLYGFDKKEAIVSNDEKSELEKILRRINRTHKMLLGFDLLKIALLGIGAYLLGDIAGAWKETLSVYQSVPKEIIGNNNVAYWANVTVNATDKLIDKILEVKDKVAYVFGSLGGYIGAKIGEILLKRKIRKLSKEFGERVNNIIRIVKRLHDLYISKINETAK